jgi:sulfhydrogenase subunit alpha
VSTRVVVDHLARVEGHGGITVELDGREVQAVRFDVYEGARLIEGLIGGRSWQEVAQIVSRICSICSSSHALTSIKATEAAFGVVPSEQTVRLRDLLTRGENIESHALHLFLLAAPDYLAQPSAIHLAATHPEAVKLGLRLKKLGNTIQERIGGRAIHPVNCVVGGWGRVPTALELDELRRDLEAALPDALAAVEVIASLPAVDCGVTQPVFAALDPGRSYNYYEGDAITVRSPSGTYRVAAPDYRQLTAERSIPHSHAKHSAWQGQPFMVGALARLTLNGSLLNGRTAEVGTRLGLQLGSGDPLANNLAQAVELEADVRAALEIVETLLRTGLDRDAARVPVVPRAGIGTGVTEAPRGILVHSYAYDAQGRIRAADIITPTAMNAAMLEEHLRAAVAVSDPDDEPLLKRRLEMVARAYDPCISCSVHLVRR